MNIDHSVVLLHSVLTHRRKGDAVDTEIPPSVSLLPACHKRKIIANRFEDLW